MRLIDADALKETVKGNGTVLTVEHINYLIDNAPTVEFPEQITIKCDTEEEKQKLLSALRNARVTICKEVENEDSN